MTLQRSDLPILHAMKDAHHGCTYRWLATKLNIASQTTLAKRTKSMELDGLLVIIHGRGRGVKTVLRLSERGRKYVEQLFPNEVQNG